MKMEDDWGYPPFSRKHERTPSWSSQAASTLGALAAHSPPIQAGQNGPRRTTGFFQGFVQQLDLVEVSNSM